VKTVPRSGAVMLPLMSAPRSSIPRAALRDRVNYMKRAGQAGGLPAGWGMGFDAQGNPIPVDASNNPIPLPSGASQWGTARPNTNPTGNGIPVPLDAQGYPVCSSGPSTGVMVGLTALGLLVGYAFGGGAGSMRRNPVHHIRHFGRRFRHHLRRASRF